MNENQIQYKVIFTPPNATDKRVIWSVENITGKATIDQQGLLTALAPGNVRITVRLKSHPEISASLDILIKAIYTNIIYFTSDDIHKIEVISGIIDFGRQIIKNQIIQSQYSNILNFIKFNHIDDIAIIAGLIDNQGVATVDRTWIYTETIDFSNLDMIKIISGQYLDSYIKTKDIKI